MTVVAPVGDKHVGIATSPGTGVGPAQVVRRTHLRVPHRRIPTPRRPIEQSRFDDAVTAVLGEFEATEAQLRSGEMSEHAALALALVGSHRAVLSDPLLIGGVQAEIAESGLCAEWALERVLDKLQQAFDRLDNPDLRDWWRDVEALASTLTRRLLGQPDRGALIARRGAVLVAHDLGVGETISVVRAGAAAVVLEQGSLTSHVAILCRSAGLPAVVGVHGACDRFDEELTLRVNGGSGVVQVIDRLEAIPTVRRDSQSLGMVPEHTSAPVCTDDGVPIVVRANLDLRLDADYARRYGTSGVGLLRTVYQYAGRTEMPSLDELTALYRNVLQDFAPEPVCIRLLDLGGPIEDDALPPPLRGLSQHRGIRLWQHSPAAIDLQLLALCRAVDAGHLRILVPFVTDPEEVLQVRSRVDDLMQGQSGKRPEIGAMVEVPAALLMIDEFAAHSDFLAIGTNDLSQFLFAVPREAPAEVSRPVPQIALLRAITLVTDAGRRAGIDVCLCGEWASEPTAVPALLRAGLRELSVSPRLAPAVRTAIAACRIKEAVCAEPRS